MELIVDEHKGMSTLIAKQKLPSYLYQMIWNLELSKILGKMVKRKGYKNVLTTGLTTLKSMFEFVDKNDGRQILIQDGTGLEESVYSGGAYGAIAGISNDERTGSATVDQAYPILFNKELRSPAGLNAATDLAFWYGYISRKRFNDDLTITAGKYIDDQFYNTKFAALDIVSSYLRDDSEMTDTGIDEDGVYFLFMAPVIDGYQRGMPDLTADYKVAITGTGVTKERLRIDLVFTNTNKAYLKRMTAIDLFIGRSDSRTADFKDLDPIYFLERVDLNSDGNVFLEKSGTLDTTGGSEKITVADFADWLSFPTTGMWIHDITNDEYYEIISDAADGADMDFTTDPVAQDSGAATLQFLTRWTDDGAGVYSYGTFFDNNYKRLGAEMFTYLGIPAGDTGLSDYRYKYGCMSNKRYFIFGGPDGPFGYFSKVNNPDVIPALNILRLKKEPTGCVAAGRDVMALYKDSAKRFTVLSNTNAEEDDDFSDIGLVSQAALYQLSDEESYGFDQRGPWHLYLRSHQFIGEDLKEWWEDNLSENEKDACVVGYNRLKNWVMYSFPTYTTSPYTTGIVFVFDRDAQKRDNVNVWWVFKTDVALYNFTQADDLHLLAGSTTKIVDLNTTGPPDETVATKALLRLMQNPILGNRFHVGRALFDYDSDTDTVVVKVSADGGSQESLTVSGDKQAVIKYMCKTLELEISTAASANEVEYGSHVITFHPKRV